MYANISERLLAENTLIKSQRVLKVEIEDKKLKLS